MYNELKYRIHVNKYKCIEWKDGIVEYHNNTLVFVKGDEERILEKEEYLDVYIESGGNEWAKYSDDLEEELIYHIMDCYYPNGIPRLLLGNGMLVKINHSSRGIPKWELYTIEGEELSFSSKVITCLIARTLVEMI